MTAPRSVAEKKVRHVLFYLWRTYFDPFTGIWHCDGARDAYYFLCSLHGIQRRA